MAINIDGAFDLDDDGIAIRNNDGDPLFYLTSGSGSPIGQAAPLPTWYIDTDNSDFWRKTGPGNNDWSLAPTFDFTTLTEAEFFFEATEETTTSDNWVTAFQDESLTKSAGDYLIIHSAAVTNGSNSKDVGHRAQWRPDASGTWFDMTSDILTIDRRDSYVLRTGFFLVTVTEGQTIEVRHQYGQTDSGGTGKIKDKGFIIWKVAD